MKKICIFILLLSLLAGMTACSKDNREPLIIYNWGEYMCREQDTYTLYGRDYPLEDVIKAFEEAYPQYKVNYLTFSDNESMYPKLDKESYDVIFPSDYMVVRLMKEDKLQPIHIDQLPNVTQYLDTRLKSIQLDPDPAISEQIFQYAVPYMYCTVGLIYNVDELEPISSKSPQEVWRVLFDPSMESRVGMYNSMRESIGVALNYLGYSLNSTDPKELEEAKQLLIQQRKTVRPLVGIDELKDKYVSGELLAGVAWSGDHVVCQQRLQEEGADPEMLQYVLPYGSNLSIDMMCIPKNAKNPKGAHDFINFMYQPDIALMNAVYVGYSSPHIDVLNQLPPEITGNTNYYPDDETIDTLEVYYSNETIDALYAEIWQTVLAN
ncbi:MAG: ABC transporter substrate-binding protein [Clostridia bacterium]|nr:ABC transporter substrate-binding protein [Clostridia bacterium]